jgi:sugar phosphate permease
VLAAMNTLWHPAAISYLSEHYREQRGLALSVHSVGASVGDALAPLSVGAIITVYGWQAATIAAAIPPVIAAVVVLALLAPSGGQRYADKPVATRGLTEYVHQLRSMLRSTIMWIICLLAGLRGMAQVGMRTFVPLYVVNELGATAVWVGATLLVFQGAGALATPVVGAASDKLGRAPVFMAGLASTAVFVWFLPSVSSLWLYTVLVGIIGASLLTLRPVIQGWALDQTPAELGGSAISVLFTMQAAFGMAVPIVGGLVADQFGLDTTFRVLAVFALSAAGATALAYRHQRGRA